MNQITRNNNQHNNFRNEVKTSSKFIITSGVSLPPKIHYKNVVSDKPIYKHLRRPVK